MCIQASENTGYFTTQDILKGLAFLSHSKRVFCIAETAEQYSSISQHVNCQIMQLVASAQERGVAMKRFNMMIQSQDSQKSA